MSTGGVSVTVYKQISYENLIIWESQEYDPLIILA